MFERFLYFEIFFAYRIVAFILIPDTSLILCTFAFVPNVFFFCSLTILYHMSLHHCYYTFLLIVVFSSVLHNTHLNTYLKTSSLFADPQTRDGGRVVPQSPWFWLLVVRCWHQHTAELWSLVWASCCSGGGSHPECQRKGELFLYNWSFSFWNAVDRAINLMRMFYVPFALLSHRSSLMPLD